MKKYGLIIVLSICIYSCKNHRNSGTIEKIHISGERAFRGTTFNIPIDIICTRDYLIIKNASTVSPVIETYDINTERKINSFASIGKGAGEFNSIGSVFFSEEQKKLFIHDRILNQISYINEDEFSTLNPIPKFFREFPRYIFNPFESCIIDSCIVFQGISKDANRWQIHTIGSENSHITGYYREDIIEGKLNGISGFRKFLSLYGKTRLLSNDDNGRIAIIFGYTDLIEIYDVKKDTIIGSSDLKQPMQLNFSDIGTSYQLPRVDLQNILGYFDLCMANSLIYCLYSDETISELIESENRSHGNEIHVFDWDANLLYKLILDIPVHCITYDKVNNKIVGIRDAPNAEIVYYNNLKI